MRRFTIMHVLVLVACSGDTASSDAGPDATHDVFHHDAWVLDAAVEADTWDGNLGVSCTGASPSFVTDVTPIFASCGGELCHASASGSPWPYSDLVNAPVTRDTCAPSSVRVVPGSLPQSYLMNKVTGLGMCPNTAMMPNGKQPLLPDQIQLIADWICQGALDN